MNIKKIIVREGLILFGIVVVGCLLLYSGACSFLGRTGLIADKAVNTIVPSASQNKFDFGLIFFYIILPSCFIYLIVRIIIWRIRKPKEK